jgi:hypothetical protein
VSGCSNKEFRITGFDWQYQSADAFGTLNFTGGTGLSLRVDHNTFEPYPTTPGYGRFLSFRVPVATPGVVVDHNTVTDEGVIVENVQPGDVNNGDAAWTQAMPFETVNAVYFEDNTMTYPHYATHAVDLDCDDGGAYVFRHNTESGNTVGNHGYDSVPNGCLMEDVYQNTLSANSTAPYTVQYRGGTGVVFSNVITGEATGYQFGITNYRSDSNGFIGSTGHGYCNGSNPTDGNSNPPASYGWPCYEQIGRTSGATNGGLTSHPLYEWDNCLNSLGCTGTGNQITATVYNAGSGTNWTPYEIVQNSDFYDSISSFNGSSGVGIGTLAGRPSTCTAGVGYWATDQSTLYQCSSTNTWATFYQPYTYPHPLQASSSPAAPTGLQATVN